jgi:multidrug resistance protein, MATE family
MNTSRPTYQLTGHPVGSIREVWSLSWPLMISIFSTGFMIFIDRLIISKTSVQLMNAITSAGCAFWTYMIFFIVMAETAEIFVGKFHGEGAFHKTALPTWQVLIFCLLLSPFFLFSSGYIGELIFAYSANKQAEIVYFSLISKFAPFFIAQFGLAAFFIGTGQPKYVTIGSILANVINLILAYYFVWILKMGLHGAATASGIAMICQICYQMACFLSKEQHRNYSTRKVSIDFPLWRDFASVGLPNAIGRMVECSAHTVFFLILASSGVENMTCVSLVQSLLILVWFLFEGLSKGATSVYANVIGAKRLDLVPRVFWTAFRVHLMLLTFMTLLLLPTFSSYIDFMNGANDPFFHDPAWRQMLWRGLISMLVFCLFDGVNWLLTGIFSSISDTQFMMWTSSTCYWLFYVLPTYIAIKWFSCGGDVAWWILATNSSVILAAFMWRYKIKILDALKTEQESIPVTI